MGLLPDTLNRGLRMRRECWERFLRRQLQRKPLVSDPGMHHARSVMHIGVANTWWRGKRSRHSRRIRNPQFYVSGKRPIVWLPKPGECGYDIAARHNKARTECNVRDVLQQLSLGRCQRDNCPRNVSNLKTSVPDCVVPPIILNTPFEHCLVYG